MNMTNQPLIVPLLAQVALSFFIWTWMLATRLQSMMKNKVRLQDLASDEGMAKIRDSINPAENFENLFEVPVLFYALVVTIMFTYNSDFIYLMGAWVFVVTRAAHSIVHCTSNHVPTRFLFYFVGSMVVWSLWLRLALQIFQFRS
jgi:hypothetical protein